MYGAQRRAKDRAYCEAAERAIEDAPVLVDELEDSRGELKMALGRLTGKIFRTT